MTRAAAALILLSCAGCFSARGGAEGFHRRVRMDKEPYGFDVGIGRDGRVRAVTAVAPPK